VADILIIDDDDAIRAILRRVLEAVGHSVREAADGKTGLRHFADHPADLVLSDILMPDMDGIEFLTTVRRRSPGARIVAMSGGAGEGILEAASALGAVAVMRKPFRMDEIKATVEGALSQP